MEKTTIANEKTNPFFVRLRRIPGEHWYLDELDSNHMNIESRIKVPETILATDFLVDQIVFFHKLVWYHFVNGELTGWLPRRNIRKNFLRINVTAIKQETQADEANAYAAVQMLLDSDEVQFNKDNLKLIISRWHGNSGNLVDLNHLVVSKTNTIKDLNGAHLRQIYKQLSRRRPIIMRVGGLNNLKSSLIVLTGYNKKLYFYNDPWTGRLESVSRMYLKKYWQKGHLQAISY